MSAKKTKSTVRSMRLDTLTMNRANVMAQHENITLNLAVNRLLDGYVRGHFVLPPTPKKK